MGFPVYHIGIYTQRLQLDMDNVDSSETAKLEELQRCDWVGTCTCT
jgi:hypothetical protein